MRTKRVCHPVSHVISLLFSTSPSHFQSTTTRSTTWTARPSYKTTLYTDHLFQNRYSRQAAQKNHSRTSIASGGNPRTKTPTPSGAEHEMWIDGYRVDYWTAAVWITVDIVTCCMLMVSTWWNAGRVVETTDSGAQTLEEGRHDQCTRRGS